MKLNFKELEVLKILHESDRALTSTEIVNSDIDLTQSTVQAVLRKLLANELLGAKRKRRGIRISNFWRTCWLN